MSTGSVDNGVVFPGSSGYYHRIRYDKNTFYVTWYGAKHDYEFTTGVGTDDAFAIQSTINACFNAGGGKIIFPSGVYLVNNDPSRIIGGVQHYAQLYIPLTNFRDPNYRTIEFIGENLSNFEGNGIDTVPVPHNGAVIYSKRFESTDRGAALLGYQKATGMSTFDSFNYTMFMSDNIHYMTRAAQGANYMTAVDMYGITQAHIKNMRVGVDTPLIFTQEPRTTTYGLKMPGQSNHAYLTVGTVLAQGYGTGVYLGEHSQVGTLLLVGNKIGCSLNGGYGVTVQQFTGELNQTNIKLFNNVPSAISIVNYECERYDNSLGVKWYEFGYDIDGNALLNVTISQSIVHIIGGAPASFLINGSPNVTVLNTEDSRTGIGTLNPTAKLTVAGNSTFTGNTHILGSAVNAGISQALNSSGGTFLTGMDAGGNGTGGYHWYLFQNGGTQYRLSFPVGTPNAGVYTSIPTSTWHVGGSFATAITTTGSNISLTDAHGTLIATSALTVTLPTAASAPGRIYYIVNYNTGGNVTFSIGVLKGGATVTTMTNNAAWRLQSNGTNWYVTGE